jgi:anaerobic selenocysteine-containing dehydrogenase
MFAAHPHGEALRRGLVDDGLATPHFGTRPVQFGDVFPATGNRRIHLFPAELHAEAPEGLYGFREDPGNRVHPLALISPSTNKTVSSTLGQLVEGEVPLEMHNADALPRGLQDGDPVRVFNEFGEVRCRVRFNPDVRIGVVSLPKGLWARHTANGLTSNTLVPDAYTDLGQGACFNDARVQVEKVAG